ncbi:MAG: flagellar biosynthetic protein FliO [Desulfobacterales bacterium]|nr:flagellar biosynthetic protein FliO [Desulfobacterales bacterium]
MALGGYLQSLVIIFSILGFLGMVLWLVKRYGLKLGVSSGRGRDLTLEDRISLGPKREICMVRYKNRRFMVGSTDHHLSLIAEMAQEKENE